MIIGSGTPSSQSNAPGPKPTTASIAFPTRQSTSRNSVSSSRSCRQKKRGPRWGGAAPYTAALRATSGVNFRTRGVNACAHSAALPGGAGAVFCLSSMWSATAGPLIDIARAKAVKKAAEKTEAKASAIAMAGSPG